MQGTVAYFDSDSHAGSVVLDDGREVLFPPEAFHASGLRHLRPGQRVRIERDEAGQVSRVTLPTLP